MSVCPSPNPLVTLRGRFAGRWRFVDSFSALVDVLDLQGWFCSRGRSSNISLPLILSLKPTKINNPCEKSPKIAIGLNILYNKSIHRREKASSSIPAHLHAKPTVGRLILKGV
jgi:hypothetical protein